MRAASRITKAGIQTHTHNIYHLLPFTRQQRLRERASILHYTYTAYLVHFPCSANFVYKIYCDMQRTVRANWLTI